MIKPSFPKLLFFLTIPCPSSLAFVRTHLPTFNPKSYTFTTTTTTSHRQTRGYVALQNDNLNQNEIITSTTNKENGDFSFFDEATLYVRAGSGGQGSSTYKKAKKSQNGIPDGGSGGRGGNVVFTLDESLNTLAGLSARTLRPNAFGGGGAAASSKRGSVKKAAEVAAAVEENNVVVKERLYSFRAEDGGNGGRMYDNGRCGEDCLVRVPPGTVIQTDFSTTDDIQDKTELGTISYDTPSIIVARGGEGGEGTATLKGKKKGATRRGPQGGERGKVHLTLEIVADVALVGVPNVGKSTFLAAVTRAKPRIADYPFTTVVPNLGTWIPPLSGRKRDAEQGEDQAAGSTGLVLCDVPGLIAGASQGVGLGHAFLRHIERCRVILHLIDATSENLIEEYHMINEELAQYGSGNLANMPQVVVVNKMDQVEGGEEAKQELADRLKEAMGHTRLMWVSAKEKEGVDDLMVRMSSYVGKMKESASVAVVANTSS